MAYMDYNSTTPPDDRVLHAMNAAQDTFGNPSSNHSTGKAAANLVADARKSVADAVGMSEQDVIFTSGATEANNMALAGLAVEGKLSMLIGATEHESVMQTCRALEQAGHECIIMPVNKDGTVDLGELESRLASGVDVVSLMAANSETGVLHPWDEIAPLARKHDVLFHCDTTQAIGKVPFDARQDGIDMVTLSSHKIYGPKGCGALVATRHARKKINAIIHGGGQERNLRSGTLNVQGIAGFGAACRLVPEWIEDSKRQEKLRDSFEKDLIGMVPSASVNGAGANRIPNTSNVRIDGVPSDALVSRLPSIEISTGSACSSDNPMPSRALLAMGLDDTAAYESFRVSIGCHTTRMDMEIAVAEILDIESAIRNVAI